MEQDIRKPVSARSRVLIERPHSATHSAGSTATSIHSPSRSQPSYHEPVSEGEDDEEYLVQTAKNEELHLRLPPEAAAQARAARESREQKLRDEAVAQVEANRSASKVREEGGDSFISRASKVLYDPSLRIDPLASSDRFDKNVSLLDDKSLQKLNDAARQEEEEEDEGGENEEEEDEDGNQVVYVDQFRAPKGKRIAVPVRVEPKVVFAAERTFLKWAHFAVLLSAVSIGLLNFIQPDDTVGIFSAACFTLTALLSIVYCGARYAYRIIKLRKRQAVDYHDRWGPAVLSLALVGSVLANLVLRLREL